MSDKRLKFADKITLERIEKMHPSVRAKVLNEYLTINFQLPTGIRLRFSQTLRTDQEQNDLYAQGRTKNGSKVTNAKAGQSIHNYGLAFDIVILYDRDGNGTYESASWNEKEDFDKNGASDWFTVVNFFKRHGWSWGGDFKSIYDSPHFELTNGETWRTLQRKRKKKDANGIYYVEL